MRFEAIDGGVAEAAAAARARFATWRAARGAVVALKGSLNWVTSKGADYLVRSAYEEPGGRRRQTSLGRRSPATEAKKAAFEAERIAAKQRLGEAEAALGRAEAACRAAGGGGVTGLAAKVLRGLDGQGLFEAGWRVIGPSAAIVAAAAADGRLIGETAAERAWLDEAERGLTLLSPEDEPPRRLLDRLVRIDRGFRRGRDGVATTASGFSVTVATPRAGADASIAAAIDFAWARRGAGVEAIGFDRRGGTARAVILDPRLVAAADLWLAGQLFRDGERRRRDRLEAEAALAVATAFGLAASPGVVRGVPREVAAVGGAALRG